MAKITPMSEANQHEARNFFVPGWAGSVLYILLAMIVIVIFNAGSIISRLSNNYVSSPQKLKANFKTLSTGFNNSFSSALGGRLGQIMLWASVGALVYLGIWLARNVLNSFENDIISSHYLHPSNYRASQTLGTSLSVKVFLLAEGIITIGFLFMAFTAALPAVTALAGSAAYNFNLATSPIYMLVSIGGVALIIYIAIVLLRLFAHLWKLL